MRFEGEEVRSIALGSAWVAAVTSLNFLRIFTEGGLQVCKILLFSSELKIWISLCIHPRTVVHNVIF